jgi:tetratricopeptide (TPR) repeat protein
LPPNGLGSLTGGSYLIDVDSSQSTIRPAATSQGQFLWSNVFVMKRTITQVSAALRKLRAICIVIIAILVASSVVGCGPSDPVQEVRDQIAAGQFREALEPLRELIGANPDDMELLFLYGRALVETGQPGLAEWPLRKAQADPDWFVAASMLIAAVEQAGGNAENAAETYAKILEANPDNMNVRIMRANVLARSPRLLHQALEEVDRILELDPTQVSAYKPRILAYLGLNQPDDAERVLLELGARIEVEQPEDNPIHGWHCATMAIFADDKGEEELARERWSICTEKYPTHINVVGKAIEFYRKKSEPENALRVARVAFEAAETGDSGYRLVMAALLRQLDREDEAEALLIEGTEQASTQIARSAALLALAEHYKTGGKLQEAADTLEEGLALTQKFAGAQPDLLFALADLWVRLGEDDRALELTSKMTVAAHRALVRGAVAHNRKEYVKAVKFYDEATRLWPENPFGPYYGAQAALVLGQVDRAFEGYLLAIRIADAKTDARTQASRILLAEGRLSTALELLATTRVAPNLQSQLLGLELTGRMRGSEAVLQFANKFSQRHPDEFGIALAVGAESIAARNEGDDAWSVVEPFLLLGFPAHNHLPILLAAVDWARTDEQMAVVESLIAPALEANPELALTKTIEGAFFERTDRPMEAVASYQAALEIEGEEASTFFRMAGVLADSDPVRALETLSLGLEQPVGLDSAAQTRIFLSAVSRLMDSPGLAAVLESALERTPTSGQIAYRLASVLEKEGGDATEIARLLRRAIRFKAGKEAVALREQIAANR